MQPLATHMVDRRLVRARGYTGVPVRHLDLGLLRERESHCQRALAAARGRLPRGLDPLASSLSPTQVD
jgi:hypothetical protein